MWIYFQNNCNVPVRVATAIYEPDICVTSGWLIQGWWTIDPQTIFLAVQTTNPTFCFYAEDMGGLGVVWNQPDGYFINLIRETKSFWQCEAANPPGSMNVGMRRVTVGQPLPAGYTYQLNCP